MSFEEWKDAKRPSPERSGPNTWLVVVLICLVVILIVRSLDFSSLTLNDPDYEARAVTPRGDLAEDEKATSELFRQSAPSVAYITTMTSRREFSFDLSDIPQGAGTGIVYDKQGHIVTNFHVIKDADSARVTLADQSDWVARLVGVAPDQDLAVLRIDAPSARLQPILVGTSNDLEVGQKVFAIGNPFGLDQTLTTGVISGLGREISSVTQRRIRGVIQTDAAINPGNSGGPLLDSAGRMIGVNTAIYSPSGAYAGIGFAVPVDHVNRVVPELIRSGRVARPVLGIVPDDRIPRMRGIEGVLIQGVARNSGAEEAGLRATHYDDSGDLQLGDIILSVNGNQTPDTNTLLDELEKHKVGDTVTLTILSSEGERDVQVRLQEG